MAASMRSLLPPLLLLLLVAVAGATDTDRFGDALPPNAVARIGTNRLRHGGPITSITFTTDSKKFATTSTDRTVSVWETETGRELLRCHAFEREPGAVAFRKDAKTLLCVADGNAYIFEIAGGKELRHFSLKADKIAAAAFSADGGWLAVGDESGQVRLWDVPEGKVLAELTSEGGVRRLAVSAEAKLIATTTGITGIHLWDATTGTKKSALGKGAYSVLTFSPDGSELAAGDFDNRMHLFDTAKGASLSDFTAANDVSPITKNSIACVGYSANGKTLASGAGDGLVRVWSRLGNQTTKVTAIEGHTDRVTAVAFSPDGKWLVSAAADNTIRLFDTSNWNEPPFSRLSAPQAPLAGMSLSPDGKFVATLDAPLGRLTLWQAHTGKAAESFSDLPAKAGAAAFTPDSKTLAVAVSAREFGFWDLQERKKRREWTFKDIDDDKAAIHAVPGMVYNADGKRLAVSMAQGLTISVFDGDSKRLAQFTATGGRRPGCLSLSPDGGTLASVGPEANVRLWDVNHNAEQATLLGHSGGTLAVAFSPNGRMIASGGKDRMIRVWEVATGEQRQMFGGQPGWVRAVAFAPDGNVLAAANTDGVVRLWDLTTGKLLHELTGHRGAVIRLAFTAKGDVLASAGVDTTVLLWDTAKLLKDRKPALVPLTPKQLEKAWDQLASSDVGLASAALQTLVRSPAETIPLLEKHVKPLKAERIAQLLKDLDSDAFPVREAAAMELAAAGKFAEPSLKAALKGDPSPEVRRSVEALLDKLRDRGPSPEELRMIRSLEVLEMIGGDDAKKILTRMAEEGAKESDLTRQAKAAVERLAKD